MGVLRARFQKSASDLGGPGGVPPCAGGAVGSGGADGAAPCPCKSPHLKFRGSAHCDNATAHCKVPQKDLPNISKLSGQ